MTDYPLPRALRAATDAALAAGALLREEFHRPGGPRGSGDHAEVDPEAERLIRDRLRTDFPDWGYLGEELGPAGPSDARLSFRVDPNDGTRAFLAGSRGFSVSIALLHDGIPVLGVVYAPCAPDDRGDLIAWAEGEPLTRNGAAVLPRALPEVLEAYDVVTVGDGAHRASAANARALAPARFLTVPSLAYRLALVAVGDAEASFSMGAPEEWDIAGGHALLRATGADLYDPAGAPVRYTEPARPARVFAGSATVARWLATRDANALAQPDAVEAVTERFPLVRPVPGRTVRDAGVLSRAQGCLLGQFAGDALGALVEFASPASILRRYPEGVRDLIDGGTWNTLAGQPTDDSEMALALARSIVARSGFDAGDALEAYRAWGNSGPFDMGGTTRAGLAGRPSVESQANGSLMRVSPLAVFAHALPAERAAALAREDSAVTHPHPACRDACGAFTVAIGLAVREGAGAQACYEAARAWAESSNADESIRGALADAARRMPESFTHQQGWVLIALQNAFYQLLHAPDVEQGVVDTVMQGGDTDTNAAIAGALLGAVHGRDGVPARWRRAVLTCRPVDMPRVRHPRPRTFWPVDALELAEALVAAGAGSR